MIFNRTTWLIAVFFSCLTVLSRYPLDARESRCGTFDAVVNPSMNISGKIRADRIQESTMQKQYLSPSGKFLIHYDTENTDTTSNAVPSADSNKNGIPDFVDSAAYYFDYALQFYVNQLGYKSPYPDDNSGGTEAYDIYVVDLGKKGYYGLTTPRAKFGGSDNCPRKYSIIAIDNDYSPLDSIVSYPSNVQTYKKYTPYEFLKITSAHELYHAVQFLYGMTKDYLLYEMTSTFWEIRLYPEIPDYVQFIHNLFTNPELFPFGNGLNSGTGYRYAIFGYFLYQRFGEGVFKTMWEYVYNETNTYLALDSALRSNGSSLDEAWCEFTQWIYFTGERAVPGQYLKYANEYPEMVFKPESLFTSPTTFYECSLSAYEFRLIRVLFPGDSTSTGDTIDVMAANTDLESAVMKDTYKRKYFTFMAQESPVATYTRVGTSRYYYHVELEDGVCDFEKQLNGMKGSLCENVFPNPFKYKDHTSLFFPVPSNVLIGSGVRLLVFDEAMNLVLEDNLPVSVYYNHLGIMLDDIPGRGWDSGVYIFRTEYGDENITGKFGIIR